MSLKQLLRFSLIAQIGFSALAVVSALVLESTLPESLRAFLKSEAHTESFPSDAILLALGVPLLILGVSSFVGLWLLRRWARPLYLASWIGSWLLLPFVGPVVSTAVEDTLWEMSAVAGGFTLALIYCSDLRHIFARAQAV